jgi:plasmid stabilization system protein ParE
MRLRIEFSERASSDLAEIHAWIAADSPANASRWLAQLESTILSLDLSPERCALAPEHAQFEGVELRQLLVGRYRILFFVRKSTVVAGGAGNQARRSVHSELPPIALHR